MYEQIINIIKFYQENNCGECYYDEAREKEFYIENEIENIFKNNNIIQYNFSIEEMFENPGCSIYSISVVWIEDGKLKTILNERLFCN